jgi:L-glyceraldehyde 3-phosphate reductase
MPYRRCGRSGLLLPAISLGLWHNFGADDDFANARAMLCRAFDLGITHFDLANNYGPPYGSAEENFGRILQQDLRPYRDEIVISTKAGYDMWPGPYGNWGSRKYLISSLDQSLRRMRLEYVDIFYSHRPDPETPVEETMSALDCAVRSGKALYAGISRYSPEQTAAAAAALRSLGTPLLIHQFSYSMFLRAPEQDLFGVLRREGAGGIAFSPLARGSLTAQYLEGRLKRESVDESRLAKARALDQLARARGQSLAQMALAWVLRDPAAASALAGAGSVQHVEENVAALSNLTFAPEEIAGIDLVLAG